MKFLVIDDEEANRDLLTLSLEAVYDCTVLEAETIPEGLQALKAERGIDCVISAWEMEQGSGKEILEFLQKASPGLPLAFTGKTRPPDEDVRVFLPRPTTVDILRKALGGLLGTDDQKPEASTSNQNLARIKIKTIAKLDVLPCDLYLKLTDKKNIKVMKQGDFFGPEDMKRYVDKKVDFLYVQEPDTAPFVQAFVAEVESLSDLAENVDSASALLELANQIDDGDLQDDLINLAKVLKTGEQADLAQVYAVSEKAHEHAHRAMLRFGFTAEVESVVRTSVTVAVNTLKQDPSLGALLAQLEVDPHSYLSSHSVTLAYLASAISSLMKWSSETTHYKLSLAAFLHDMTINNQDIAQCRNMIDVLSCGTPFSPEEISSFQNHPKDAAEMANEITMIPPDVGIIILQHHERPDGSGFPVGLKSNRISPLSGVFIIAHDLVHWMLKHPDRKGLAEYLQEAEKEFSQSHFGRIMAELRAAVRDGRMA